MLAPKMDITILERQQRVLKKVEISGGGRCNCTNTFERVSDLSQVYPRGHRLLKRLFRSFGPEDAYNWFESHGVPLQPEPDGCVFPAAQDSHAIIRCFLDECQRLGIHIHLGVDGFAEALPGGQPVYDYVVVTTGGMSPVVRTLFDSDDIVPPLPSLFTFSIADSALHQLMGLVVEHAVATIPGTRFKAEGPLLITHWGMSGPAILKLSSHAARYLAEQGYRTPLAINWCGSRDNETIREELTALATTHAARQVTNARLPLWSEDGEGPLDFHTRLWTYLLQRAGISPERKWGEVGRKQLNRFCETLTHDSYTVAGRYRHKDEFVTCGGISLEAIDSRTLESKRTPHLYFAGEVLDIDGVTGGFNFQAAWTTADTVARAIAANAIQV